MVRPSKQKPPESRMIPSPTWPHRPVTYVLLILLVLQSLICLSPPSTLPEGLRAVQALALSIFHTHRALKLFFLFTTGVHLLEALYALSLLRRVSKVLGWRALLWCAQTAFVGFPSLLLLMELLARKKEV